ncbi:LCP family protein [Patescibacteria group bacterium]|nr:LCP family protein [Patescibacteria group bacterium]
MATTTTNSNTDKSELDLKKCSVEKLKKEDQPTEKPGKKNVKLSRLKRRLLKHVWLVRLGILLGFIITVFLLFIFIIFTFKKSQANYYLGLVSNFIFTPAEKIKTIDNKTNILILGKGGGNHEAPDLTDTIMFASIDHQDFSVSLISLPRDIWIPELRAKLNSAYYWGNEKEKDGGLKLAKSSVEKIVGQPVQYGVVIDFEAFKGVIDVLGGIEVDVENSFVDENYPIPGKENDECLPAPAYADRQAGEGNLEFKCRYETLRFAQGKQHMDGELALKFVRSRNAEGDEGTDFARAERQQKVIVAIKEKVLSREILFSFDKLIKLRDVLLEYTETDIDMSTIAILARRFLQSRENINSFVLPEDLLENPPKLARYDYLYVFIPKEKDPSTDSVSSPQASSGQGWNEIHEWVKCTLEVSCN